MILTDTEQLTPAQQAQAEARQMYLESCGTGVPLTGVELGREFGRTERWGQERIREAKSAAASSPAIMSSAPEATSLPPVTLTPPNAEPEIDETLGRIAKWKARRAAHRAARQAEKHMREAQQAAEREERKARPAAVQVPTKRTRTVPAMTSAESAQGQPRGAAAAAWLALVLGVGASIGANILHTILVVDQGDGSIPQIIGAAFWPVALVVAIEVMARVRWPRSFGYTLIRFAGVGCVAAVAAVVSYKHMVGLLTYWGEDALSAHLGPIAVDGLVTVGALALLAIHKTRKSE